MQRTVVLVVASIAISVALSLLATTVVRLSPRLVARVREPLEGGVTS